MNKKILALVPFSVLLLLGAQQADAINANFMEGQFEEVMNIPQVNSIEAWEQPKTKYTPKNLRSEYQVRYNGSDTNGRNAYSYTQHFTDYDTYITETYEQDGKYFAKDNTGKIYLLGDKAKDFTPEITKVDNSVKQIDNSVKQINNNISNIQGDMSTLNKRVDNIDKRLDNMNTKIEQGFATVTALTSLHPNPRSNEKLEVSIGAGVYRDNAAGAIGLFYHPNDRVQIYAGGAYGGDSSFAGGAGITFSLGKKKK